MRYTIEKSRFIIATHARNAPFTELLKWQLAGTRAKWPRWVENTAFAPPPNRVEGAAIKATWIGHSTVLIQTAGMNILTDPFFSRFASPLRFAGPRRVRAPGVTLANLPPVDAVLLSHNHYDHLDLPSLRTLQRRFKPVIFTPLGNARYIRRAARHIDVREMDWRETTDFRGVRITVMPALHWSKRSLRDTNHALWGAFVIEAAGGVIYFAGDTGYGDGATFREVNERFGGPQLSLLPIGAYEPRWFMKAQHMNPEEAVMAHLDLGSQKSLAIHHATIQLTDEAMDAPAADLSAARTKFQMEPGTFLTPQPGEGVEA
jgi:L-ascorbate metabolism protein UlaG (beta-lactamase superfamily)